MNKDKILSNQERRIWAALASDVRFGARHFAKFIATEKDLCELWHIPRKFLESLQLESKMIALFNEIRQTVDPEKISDDLDQKSIRFTTIYDLDYPNLLKEVAVPPAVLYFKGKLNNDLMLIAMVGSRKASVYGKQVTDEIARKLVASGIGIISGLALGIDSQAHLTTISTGGITSAILPGGLDRIYPASNINLASRIIDSGGALISEFPPGTQAFKHHFPIRNRIIAGMTKATIVIEASEKSGSLLTARSALEANRDVFAVPGSIYSPLSTGPHHLIQMGAKLVHRAEDILLELNVDQIKKTKPATNYSPASVEEKIILESLNNNQIINLDDLVELTDLDTSKLSSVLTLMEMKGLIRNTGNNSFLKII